MQSRSSGQTEAASGDLDALTVYNTRSEARREMLRQVQAVDLSDAEGPVIDLAGPYRYRHGWILVNPAVGTSRTGRPFSPTAAKALARHEAGHKSGGGKGKSKAGGGRFATGQSRTKGGNRPTRQGLGGGAQERKGRAAAPPERGTPERRAYVEGARLGLKHGEQQARGGGDSGHADAFDAGEAKSKHPEHFTNGYLQGANAGAKRAQARSSIESRTTPKVAAAASLQEHRNSTSTAGRRRERTAAVGERDDRSTVRGPSELSGRDRQAHTEALADAAAARDRGDYDAARRHLARAQAITRGAKERRTANEGLAARQRQIEAERRPLASRSVAEARANGKLKPEGGRRVEAVRNMPPNGPDIGIHGFDAATREQLRSMTPLDRRRAAMTLQARAYTDAELKRAARSAKRGSDAAAVVAAELQRRGLKAK